MSIALRRRLRAFIDSLDEFTNRHKEHVCGDALSRIIVNEFPFLKRAGAKFFQQSSKLLGECRSSLRCEVLARNANAPVGAGNHYCLEI